MCCTNWPGCRSPGIRLRRRGSLCFAFNCGDEPWPIPGAPALLFGSETFGPQDAACWQLSDA